MADQSQSGSGTTFTDSTGNSSSNGALDAFAAGTAMGIGYGRNDTATQVAQDAAGNRYEFGGSGPGSTNVTKGTPAKSWDCSGIAGDMYDAYTGRGQGKEYTTDASGQRMNTTSDFGAMGFEKGYQPGAFNIGVDNRPGASGHMVSELPNGAHVESSGPDGVEYGSGARSVNDPMFNQQWHLPGSGEFDSNAANAASSAIKNSYRHYAKGERRPYSSYLDDWDQPKLPGQIAINFQDPNWKTQSNWDGTRYDADGSPVFPSVSIRDRIDGKPYVAAPPHGHEQGWWGSPDQIEHYQTCPTCSNNQRHAPYKKPRRRRAISEHPSREFLHKLMQHIEDNGWQGVTLKEHPGDAPKSGYMVSLRGREQNFPIDELSGQKLLDYIKDNHELINSDPENYLGGWLESNRWYNDVSHRHHRDKGLLPAATDAFRNDQLALYDLDNDQAIDTDEAGWMTGAPWKVGHYDLPQGP